MRSARADDVPVIYRMTRDLAILCDELHDLIETEEGMVQSFTRGGFDALVLETAEGVVAMAIFQESYRTWSGLSLYLQDLIVSPSCRGCGMGTLVFKVLSAIALARGCDRLFWESTVDNHKAHRFYSATIGAKHCTELLTWKLAGRERLVALSN